MAMLADDEMRLMILAFDMHFRLNVNEEHKVAHVQPVHVTISDKTTPCPTDSVNKNFPPRIPSSVLPPRKYNFSARESY